MLAGEGNALLGLNSTFNATCGTSDFQMTQRQNTATNVDLCFLFLDKNLIRGHCFDFCKATGRTAISKFSTSSVDLAPRKIKRCSGCRDFTAVAERPSEMLYRLASALNQKLSLA